MAAANWRDRTGLPILAIEALPGLSDQSTGQILLRRIKKFYQ
jgi:hypothetical protein